MNGLCSVQKHVWNKFSKYCTYTCIYNVHVFSASSTCHTVQTCSSSCISRHQNAVPLFIFVLYFQAPTDELTETQTYTKTAAATHGKAPLISEPPLDPQPLRGHGQSTTDRRTGNNMPRMDRGSE